jgi:hypothetical protein
MATARESGRLKDANQKRVLDEAARQRRTRKALEALEQDNFHEDPHADLGMCNYVLRHVSYVIGIPMLFIDLLLHVLC